MAMDIIFFEGFNYSSTEDLDPHYWSTSGALSFNGDTVNISNRPWTSGLSANTTLTLNNFIEPFTTHSGVGIGVELLSQNNYTAIFTPVAGYETSPIGENLISFYNNAGKELRIDIEPTTRSGSGSMGFAVYEDNMLLDIYDINNYATHSWTMIDNGQVRQLISSTGRVYLEIYIDNQQLSMRLSASESLEVSLLNNSASGIFISTNAPISNLSSIKFYGSHNASVYGYRRLDNLYLTASDSEVEAFLGSNARIVKLDQYGFFYIAQMDWKSNNYLNHNYIYSSGINDIALWNVDDTYEEGTVGGIRMQQTIRKSFPSNDADCTNVMTSGAGGPIINIGDIYNINSVDYTTKSSFAFINPVTSSPWTIQELNDMQIGIKSLGPQ